MLSLGLGLVLHKFELMLRYNKTRNVPVERDSKSKNEFDLLSSSEKIVSSSEKSEVSLSLYIGSGA